MREERGGGKPKNESGYEIITKKRKKERERKKKYERNIFRGNIRNNTRLLITRGG